MENQELIRRFRNGDYEAFNLLVYRWQKPIFNFVLKYMGNREISQDITQKTFIKCYRNLKKLRQPEKFTTWLFQIAVNLCRDELKRKRYTMLTIVENPDKDNENKEEPDCILVDNESSPEKEYTRKDTSRFLKKALLQLPEKQRVVIIMKEYHGLKFTEIAEVLNEPLNTIKSRMYYGLKALRKIIENLGLSREELDYEM